MNRPEKDIRVSDILTMLITESSAKDVALSFGDTA